MSKSKSLYVGDKEIQGISDKVVYFMDGTEKVYPERQLKYIVTNEPKDLTQFNDLVIENVVNDVMKLIKENDINDVMGLSGKILDMYEEHDIKMSQIDPIGLVILTKIKEIIQTVANSYMTAYKLAIGKAFNTYEEGIHPDYFIDNIKMSDVSRLKQ